MAEIVNLRHIRKQKARAEAGKLAEQNRISFGLGKAERSLAEARRRKDERHVEGHRLSRDDSPEEP